MKKFEEEIDKQVSTFDVVGHHNGVCCLVEEVKALGKDWVSPEDHQKVVEELTNARSSITNLMAQLDYYKKDKRFEVMAEEILSLKSQLEKQQPKIPEVPQFVADWYEEHKDDLDYMIYETCAKLQHNSVDEFEQWFGEAKNKSITTLVHMKNGYTVAKEKRYVVEFLSDNYDRYILMQQGDEQPIIDIESNNDGFFKQEFTEQEIKDINEQYWAFAELVEE
ncbi:MAG TPA: hypothetical protein DIW25_09125 [Lactococcus garvieae]|uniref:DUF1642 domain-containing protein n=1 Tax=Lactococcus garvieae TaxID=1363 RepID=UPI000EEC3C28|nr:DUF1642 domain-containing protein [Lactococcus garvieae]HCS86716.1 hypothetical protein [Lactococcus garvieae]